MTQIPGDSKDLAYDRTSGILGSDKAKQTQEMHCFRRQGPKCSDPEFGETEPEPLDSEKEVAMKPQRSCAQDSDAVGAAPQFKGAESKTPAVNTIKQRTRPVVHRGPPSGRDPCRQRPLLGPGRGRYSPSARSYYIPFHDPAPQGSCAAGRAATGCPTSRRERTLFLDLPASTARVRAPRTPRRRLQVGPQGPHQWAQMSWDTVAQGVRDQLIGG